MSAALVLVAPGAEEMELTIVIDVLRRGGVEVTMAGVAGPDPVVCSRSVTVCPDIALDAAGGGPWDALMLPGGAQGARELASSAAVGRVLLSHWNGGRIVGAVCAAPIALRAHGVAVGASLTAHPSVQDALKDTYKVNSEAMVVSDGQLITSQGPGSCFEWALELLARLEGAETAEEVRAPLCLPS